jgi:bifunctional DNA-binding transcriptional regulator/antitoxin component of YhaV-PrlF toxin-antitoxin module
MKRIAETTFPAKFTVRGTQRYVTVPILVAERMGIHDGDYLDVTVRWPKTEDFDIDELLMPAAEQEDKPKRGRKKTENDE